MGKTNRRVGSGAKVSLVSENELRRAVAEANADQFSWEDEDFRGHTMALDGETKSLTAAMGGEFLMLLRDELRTPLEPQEPFDPPPPLSTEELCRLEEEEARSQGFDSAEAYYVHLHEILHPKEPEPRICYCGLGASCPHAHS